MEIIKLGVLDWLETPFQKKNEQTEHFNANTLTRYSVLNILDPAGYMNELRRKCFMCASSPRRVTDYYLLSYERERVRTNI